jgi:hypothetical protein
MKSQGVFRAGTSLRPLTGEMRPTSPLSSRAADAGPGLGVLSLDELIRLRDLLREYRPGPDQAERAYCLFVVERMICEHERRG